MTEKTKYTRRELDNAINALLPAYSNITPTYLKPTMPALLKIVAEEFFLNRFDLSQPETVYRLDMCRAAMVDLHEHGHFVFANEN
ncbi:hypothetical protein VmeM32_00187 [Vibrio phage vB_VmeM-32]|nr:hypothetical protein VmeM32_00187 [Vibrio phage vB_VmeM-32]